MLLLMQLLVRQRLPSSILKCAWRQDKLDVATLSRLCMFVCAVCVCVIVGGES